MIYYCTHVHHITYYAVSLYYYTASPELTFSTHVPHTQGPSRNFRSTIDLVQVEGHCFHFLEELERS